MYCTSALPNDSEGASIKCEEQQQQQQQQQQQPSCSPPETQDHTASNTSTSYINGEYFARSAYGAMQETRELDEMEYEIVEKPPQESGYPRPVRLHRPSRKSNLSTGTSRIARLQQYRHERDIDNTNESVFKSRYAILRPKSRFLDPRTGRIS